MTDIHDTFRDRAVLDDIPGRGLLIRSATEHGDFRLAGLWRPEESDHTVMERLHDLYMAREPLNYRGPVREPDETEAHESELRVVICEWSDAAHPDALKLEAWQDESPQA